MGGHHLLEVWKTVLVGRVIASVMRVVAAALDGLDPSVVGAGVRAVVRTGCHLGSCALGFGAASVNLAVAEMVRKRPLLKLDTGPAALWVTGWAIRHTGNKSSSSTRFQWGNSLASPEAVLEQGLAAQRPRCDGFY